MTASQQVHKVQKHGYYAFKKQLFLVMDIMGDQVLLEDCKTEKLSWADLSKVAKMKQVTPSE